MHHEVWLWNRGGYFCLLVGRDGAMGIPQGEKAWRRFAAYAPGELLEKAVAAAKAYRHAQKGMVADGRES